MTRVLGQLCLAGAVLAPLTGAIVAVVGKGLPGRRCQTAAGLGWVSAGLAIVAATSVALGGPFAVALVGAYSQPVLGLWADQLTVTLLVLVCGVGAVVQSFSVRYLQADRAAPRFFAAANVVVSAMAVVCTSATAAVLVAAWVAAGMGFVAVVGYRPDLPGVRASTRRTLGMFAVGDLALVAGLVMIWARAGNVDVVSAGAQRAAAGRLGGLSTVVALLVVAAALTRSAQGPLGRWLPGTVSAPTPASALLHAGVVNGGGILLVRLGALTGDSALAMVAAFTVAGLTATVATALMTRKADVKGALAFSTMGQMGFMIAECAVGAYLAAVVHLIGHAMYKATLFFGSGSQISRTGQAPAAPAAAMSTLARTAATGTAAAATVAAMAAVPGVLAHRGGVVLLIFVAATAATAGWSWWGRRPASARLTASWATVMPGAGALYGLVLGGLGRWIGPALPTAEAGTLSPWWLLGVAGAGLAMAGLTRVPGAQRRLVAVLVDAGAPPVQLPMGHRRPDARGARAGLPDFVPEAAGSWAKGAT
ncbi:MAG: proton-conducting transporter transmembrane domain-containing protein [Actinomycetes bacterium]